MTDKHLQDEREKFAEWMDYTFGEDIPNNSIEYFRMRAAWEKGQESARAESEKELQELRKQLEECRKEVEFVKNWYCHNGGLVEGWMKEWSPSKHPPLTEFIRKHLDAAIEGGKKLANNNSR